MDIIHKFYFARLGSIGLHFPQKISNVLSFIAVVWPKLSSTSMGMGNRILLMIGQICIDLACEISYDKAEHRHSQSNEMLSTRLIWLGYALQKQLWNNLYNPRALLTLARHWKKWPRHLGTFASDLCVNYMTNDCILLSKNDGTWQTKTTHRPWIESMPNYTLWITKTLENKKSSGKNFDLISIFVPK